MYFFDNRKSQLDGLFIHGSTLSISRVSLKKQNARDSFPSREHTPSMSPSLKLNSAIHILSSCHGRNDNGLPVTAGLGIATKVCFRVLDDSPGLRHALDCFFEQNKPTTVTARLRIPTLLVGFPSLYSNLDRYKSLLLVLYITMCAIAGDELRRQIQSWMDDVDALSSEEGGRVKAIIAPHAGYAYSGPTMAYAYKHIKPETMYV